MRWVAGFLEISNIIWMCEIGSGDLYMYSGAFGLYKIHIQLRQCLRSFEIIRG